jgi:hypothetical protein
MSCVGLLLASSSVLATTTTSDRRPPRTRLDTDGRHQRGRLNGFDWSKRDSATTCVSANGLGSFQFSREGLHVGAGPHTVNVTFFKAQRPNQTQVLLWHKIDSNRMPVGSSAKLRYRLHHRGRGAHSSWVARFSMVVDGNAYLEVSGRWRDEEGCGGQQDADWLFHLAS